MRPQATSFAESAKARESVMSLGSIAHLQYYFARTGLLDGKGAQLAQESEKSLKRKKSGVAASMPLPSQSPSFLSADGAESCALSDGGLADSPVDGEDADWDEMMLPPTVSTYNQRPAYVAPPPDLTMLRRELTEGLEDALKVLKETDKSPDANGGADGQGWYEIQGLHLLDITTLAIRAAKNYYTAHTQPARLYAIKPERQIRGDLYQVLEILKRMAARNFAGGIRQQEKVGILTWIVGISELIQAEIDGEKREVEERGRWVWRTGDWTGRERERERAFVKSFLPPLSEAVPEWIDPSTLPDEDLPTDWMRYFASGLRLIQLHNALVRASRRSFEEIGKFHIDTAKPYRRAENLRFWLKAAELRWEVGLRVDVGGVVAGDKGALRGFDEAVLKWCRAVREEMEGEWGERVGRRAPMVRVQTE
ncbi:hypothetical protein EJ06DRAFT_490487 [Trichodelitschia bisporula]|uniref:Uncharacterized protein n=1 Tax=Trichodelitschia bisporula TaxID=703511 RepID=A0A6G1I1Q4_9PEZI|nr:hypothetical protein EJ06DRAFT_490487 [Trichodelitschia bisporula]